jgi:hypothetical protein
MFGINEQGKTASIFVEDYLPFFYAKVDNKWKEQDKLEFILKIKNDLGDYYDDAIVKSKLIKKKKLYGFDGEQSHSFILIQFKNEAAMKKAKNLWYDSSVSDNGDYKKLLKPDGYYDSVLYEAQIPPLLRLFHIKEISPSGWISLAAKMVTKHKVHTTSCDYEFTIKFKDIIS